MPALETPGWTYCEGWLDALTSFCPSSADQMVVGWGEGITLSNAGIRWALCPVEMCYRLSAPWFHSSLPSNPQPPGLTFSICFPCHCIPASASTSMPWFPLRMKANPFTSFLPQTPLNQAFYKLSEICSNIKYYLQTCHVSDTLEKHQSAGLFLPPRRWCQVKGSCEDAGSPVIPRVHGERSSPDLIWGRRCTKKENNNLLEQINPTLRPMVI